MANIETSLFTQADEIREDAGQILLTSTNEFKGDHIMIRVEMLYSYAKGLEFALQCMKPTEKNE